MKKTFLLCLWMLIAVACHASVSDSLDRKRTNQVELELAGNNYLVPFTYSLSHDFLLSLKYSKLIILPQACFEVSVALSGFRSGYSDEINHQFVQPPTKHDVKVLSVPIGLLWRPNNKRNSFWVGGFYTMTFGKQQYLAFPDRNSYLAYTIDFDYQFSPTLCYQFRSKKEGLVCKLFWDPKFSSGIKYGRESFNQGYDWRVNPLWGGISIGEAW